MTTFNFYGAHIFAVSITIKIKNYDTDKRIYVAL